MALYVYYNAEQLLHDDRPQKNMEEERIKKFMRHLEESQSILLLDRYSSGAVKKRFGKIRAVGWLYNLGEGETLLAWSFIFMRAQDSYAHFLDEQNQAISPLRYGKPDHDSDFFKNAKGWYDQEKQNNARKPLDPLNMDEAVYLTGFHMKEPSNEQVFETSEWVQAVAKYFFSADEAMQQQQRPLLEDIRRSLSELDLTTERHECFQVGPYYVEFIVKKQADQPFVDLILINIKEDDIKTEKYGVNIDIRHAAMRAYDREFLAEGESVRWLRLQKYPKSSLAFSNEQLALLRETLSLEGKEATVRLPLFINGCAGSGKTTILYYLFEQYLMQYIEKSTEIELELKPVYLSYSENLIRNAKQHVTQIIRERTGDEHLELPPLFFDFHSFLLSFLDESEHRLFPKSKRVYYDRFRAKFDSSFKGRQGNGITADQVWHVIRTFIKGYDCDVEEARHFNRALHLTPEEYEELPNDWKHVNAEVYREIYERYYEKWYLEHFPPNEQYWDDQDLMHYVLTSKEIKPEYGAIFADEVQDFTNVEFLFLLKLTPYYQRMLYSHQISQLPFVYVGDPYQTIQPTGFDWKILRKHYYDRFIRTLDPNHQSHMKDIRIRDLTYNYRSTPAIVYLSNSVQQLRKLWLGKKEPFMQQAWQLASSEQPMVYLAEEIGAEHPIWQVGPEIIIPVNDYRVEEEGGRGISSIVEYIEKDDFLGPVININEEREVAQNVWNSVKAKGLEFEEVILYGFGQYFVEQRAQWFPQGAKKTTAIAYYQEKEFFINKLYVSVTRAKRRLIIADTKEGVEQFWMNREVFTDAQEHMVLQLEKGNAEDLRYVDSNALDKAQRLEQMTLDQTSLETKRDLFNRARQFYIAATYDVADGEMRETYVKKAKRCQALAEHCVAQNMDYRTRKQWDYALQLLEEAGEFRLAADVFWQLGEFEDLSRIAPFLGNDSEWHNKLAIVNELRKTEYGLKEVDLIFSLLPNTSSDTDFHQALVEKVCTFIENVLKKQIDSPDHGVTDAIMSAFFQLLLENMSQYAIHLPAAADLVGYAHYRLHSHEEACSVWERYGKNKGVFRALHFGESQGKYLYSQFETNPDRKWSSEELRRLSSYFLSQKNEQLLVEILAKQGDAFTAMPIIADSALESTVRLQLAVSHLQRVNQLDEEQFLFYVEETKKWSDSKRNYMLAISNILEQCALAPEWASGLIKFPYGIELPELVRILILFGQYDEKRVQFEDALFTWLHNQNYRKPKNKEHLEAKKEIENHYNARKMEEIFRFIYLNHQQNKLQTVAQYEDAINRAKEYSNILKELKPEDWYRFSIKRAVQQIRSAREEIVRITTSEFTEKQYNKLRTELGNWIQTVRDSAKAKISQPMQGLHHLEQFENIDFKAFFRSYELALQNVERDVDIMYNWQFNSSKVKMEVVTSKARNNIKSLFEDRSLRFAMEKVYMSVSNFGWKSPDIKNKVLHELQQHIDELKQGRTHVAKFSLMLQRIKELLDVGHIAIEDKRDLVEKNIKNMVNKLQKNMQNIKDKVAPPIDDNDNDNMITELVHTGNEPLSQHSIGQTSLMQASSNIYDVMKDIARQMGTVDSKRYREMEQTLFELLKRAKSSEVNVDNAPPTDV